MSTTPPQRVNPLAAFTPFTAAEIRRLERHVELAERLASSPFLTSDRLSWTLQLGDDEPPEWSSGDVALAAALPVLRQLYQEPRVGFESVRTLLREHASTKGGRPAEAAIAMLDRHGREHRELLRTSPYGALLEEVVEGGRSIGSRHVRPREALEDYLNAEHFHSDEGRGERLAQWREFGFHEWVFIDAADRLARFYVRFAEGPRRLVAEPGLRAATDLAESDAVQADH